MMMEEEFTPIEATTPSSRLPTVQLVPIITTPRELQLSHAPHVCAEDNNSTVANVDPNEHRPVSESSSNTIPRILKPYCSIPCYNTGLLSTFAIGVGVTMVIGVPLHWWSLCDMANVVVPLITLYAPSPITWTKK